MLLFDDLTLELILSTITPENQKEVFSQDNRTAQ